MKKWLITFLALVISVISVTSVLAFALTGNSQPTIVNEPEVKTISDIGNATIAGEGAYYDDGMLKYASSGNTIGYQNDFTNTLVEFDIIFDYIRFPAWFSLTFKADGFDRTQSPNLTQKGYSIIIFYSGAVEVWKPDLQADIVGSIPQFKEGVKYRFKIGAYNDNGSVRIYLSVDGNEIINAVDSVNPYLNGNWFNICGDGGTSARLFSTKKEVVPNYQTYTLSTIGDYPTATDTGVSYDKYKNITLHSGTIGWWQGLRNFSLETKMNWEAFGPGANVWVALRAATFDRATSAYNGYLIRIGVVGVVQIYKGNKEITSGGWDYKPNTDFVFEFGTVDLDEDRTMIFVNVNNKPVATMIDDDQPIKTSGWVNFNGDGEVNCKMTSVSTKVTPLLTKITENDNQVQIQTYFNNPISYTDMEYEQFTDILLDAIWLNSSAVKEWNDAYYSLEESDKVNAVDLKCVNNKLVININKTLYSKVNDAPFSFVFNELVLKKTGENKGFVCPSSYALKQTYYYSI